METLQRIEKLERRLKSIVVVLITVIGALGLGGWMVQSGSPEVLRVRQITIVDETGTERVWIGAPVPDPIIQGERRQRSGPVSGLIVLDADGNERGGFVTSDLSGEVFMGLDSQTRQETLFLVNPGGGGHLSIYDADGNLARIGVLRGRPTLLLRENGESVFEQPSGVQ